MKIGQGAYPMVQWTRPSKEAMAILPARMWEAARPRDCSEEKSQWVSSVRR